MRRARQGREIPPPPTARADDAEIAPVRTSRGFLRSLRWARDAGARGTFDRLARALALLALEQVESTAPEHVHPTCAPARGGSGAAIRAAVAAAGDAALDFGALRSELEGVESIERGALDSAGRAKAGAS